MIGKTTKGSGFGGLLRYVFEKEKARYIGGNMAGTTPEELANEFRAIAKRNSKVQIPVAHISFSPSPSEHLDDLQALEFAQAYMDKIGFGENQWVLAGHNDTKTSNGQERPHFHIIANRVRMTDAKVVTAWRDWRRSEVALRELEEEFNLVKVQPSWEIDKGAPSTGQQRRYKREKEKYEALERDLPPEYPVKVQLQKIIDRATASCPTIPTLIEQLQDAGVEVKVGFTRTGKVKGISYQLDKVAFSGTHLGKAYTFPGLQKHRGVDYDSTRDDDSIKRLIGRSVEDKADTTGKPQARAAKTWDEQPTRVTDDIITDANADTDQLAALASQESLMQSASAQIIRPVAAKILKEGSQSVTNSYDTDQCDLTMGRAGGANSVESSTSVFDTIQQQRTQFVATVVTDYLLEKKTLRLQGKRYTAYREDDQLVLVGMSEESEIMRATHKNDRWEPVGSPQLSEAHVQDFQVLALQIQQERAAVIAPIAIQFFEARHTKGKIKQIRSNIWHLEGINYLLTYDKTARTFSIQSTDGRGELVRVKRNNGNTLELAQGIESRDVVNFQRIAQVMTQEKDLASNQNTY
ncbi:MAG TPA: relaxase/mobilization nuclease domain-containing protein [Oculatellaceae cyanobacterium]